MRNAIKYYYNIDIEDLRYIDQEYIFGAYILKEIKKDIDVNLYNFLMNNNFYIHQIVYNVNNNIITKIDNRNYILLHKSRDAEVSLPMIASFLIDIDTNQRKDWARLWEMKVDYYERNIINTIDKETLDVFPYYIGLSELAIRIYKENNYDTTYSICHNRLITSNDFYSPDNIVTDYKVRDIAEYVKIAFFNNTFKFTELVNIMEQMFLKEGDYIILYARLMFPTYFYDCIENGQDIKLYSSKINQYEDLLNQLYYYFNTKVRLPKIDWLIKKI